MAVMKPGVLASLSLLVAAARSGELNTNASSYSVPEGFCFRILRSIEGGTNVSPVSRQSARVCAPSAHPLTRRAMMLCARQLGEYRSKVVVRNASGAYAKFYLFENGDSRCEVPMADAGGEQGLLEQANRGCISEALPSATVSWVDTITEHGGASLLTVAAFDRAGCAASRPRPTFANWSYGELNTELHAMSIPDGVCHLVARPIGLRRWRRPSGDGATTPSAAAPSPVYRRLRGFRNSSGEYVASTHYDDAWCRNATGGDETALGPRCFEQPAAGGPSSEATMSFSLGWDSTTAMVEEAVYRGAVCAEPHTFPVNWGLGELNINRSSFRAGDGECIQQLRPTVQQLSPAASSRPLSAAAAPRYARLIGFRNGSGEYIRRSHFADDGCTMPVFSDLISAGRCVNETAPAADSAVAQGSGSKRQQSWFAVWDATQRATTATFYVGGGCAVAAAYPVNRGGSITGSAGGSSGISSYDGGGGGGAQHPQSNEAAARRLRRRRRQLQEDDLEEGDEEVAEAESDAPWFVLLVGGLCCGCFACYWCVFVLMGHEIKRQNEEQAEAEAAVAAEQRAHNP
jgi:hypothetical protein